MIACKHVCAYVRFVCNECYVVYSRYGMLCFKKRLISYVRYACMYVCVYMYVVSVCSVMHVYTLCYVCLYVVLCTYVMYVCMLCMYV